MNASVHTDQRGITPLTAPPVRGRPRRGAPANHADPADPRRSRDEACPSAEVASRSCRARGFTKQRGESTGGAVESGQPKGSVMQPDATAGPYESPRAWRFPRWQRRFVAEVTVHGKPVVVEWSRAAQAALARRAQPLTLELELYFSCLVKKSVRFAESPAGCDTADAAARTVAVGEHLRLRFRTVTSTACSIDVAQRLGRQPEVELDGAVARRLAPRRVWLDHRRGAWTADYWM